MFYIYILPYFLIYYIIFISLYLSIFISTFYCIHLPYFLSVLGPANISKQQKSKQLLLQNTNSSRVKNFICSLISKSLFLEANVCTKLKKKNLNKTLKQTPKSKKKDKK